MNYSSNGSKKITLSGTNVRVSLGSVFSSGMQDANRVDIQAGSGNSALVVIGDNQINNDLSNGGIALQASDTYCIEIIKDLQSIFVVGTAGDSITFNYWIGDRN